jgi:penicillin-binding protein 1A
MRFTGRQFFIKTIWAGLSVMITGCIALAILCTFIEVRLPNTKAIKDMHMQVPLRIYSEDHQLMAIYGTKQRIPVTLQQIPPTLTKAVLAVEDARYYHHPGVDFIGLIRAAKAVITTGHKVQGASTITMQVARNFFLTRKKTYSRKLREILLALKIDQELSKDKVLELYLNKVYFGNRAYGVAAAAQVYYGKSLQQLTLPQMAMIAGLPQAPSRNNPISNPSQAIKRRNHVLKRMLEVNSINKTTYQKAIQAPVTAQYHQQKIALQAPYVAELVRQTLVATYGKEAYEKGYTVTTTINAKLQRVAQQSLQQGLINYSLRHGFRGPIFTLDNPANIDQATWQAALQKIPTHNLLQAAAITSCNKQSVSALLPNGTTINIDWAGLSWARPKLKDGYVGKSPKTAGDIVQPGDVVWVEKLNNQWQLSQAPQAQGALVSMTPDTGAITAITGGYDYDLSKFNRATQALRQTGSSFKPFIYSAALNKGYTLASIINDAPIVIKDTGENQLWRPKNDNEKFYGPTRLRVGLAESRNLVSVRLLQDITIPYALQYVKRFGFNDANLPNSLSLALGAASIPPLQLTAHYAIFANGGFHVTPHLIQKVTDQDNQTVYQSQYPTACIQCVLSTNQSATSYPANMAPEVITPQNAYIMNRALKDVITQGTGRAAKILHRTDLAGKTGTTNKQADAWFAGFNRNVVTTVWVGFDNLQSLHEYGSKAALPIWINFMQAATHNMPEANLPIPPGIITVRIDPSNGLLAQPDQKNAIFEVFRKKYEPHTMSKALSPSLNQQAGRVNQNHDDDQGAAPIF